MMCQNINIYNTIFCLAVYLTADYLPFNSWRQYCHFHYWNPAENTWSISYFWLCFWLYNSFWGTNFPQSCRSPQKSCSDHLIHFTSVWEHAPLKQAHIIWNNKDPKVATFSLRPFRHSFFVECDVYWTVLLCLTFPSRSKYFLLFQLL